MNFRGAPTQSTQVAGPPSALLRGVQVLLCLVEAGTPLTITKLAAVLGLPTSTAHRILKTLKATSYVVQDNDSRYRVGPSFFRSASTLASVGTFQLHIQRVQQKLVEDSGESAFYGAYLSESGRLRFIATLQSHQAIRYVMRTDVDHSLLWGASGLSISAALPEQLVNAIYLRDRDSGEGEYVLPKWEKMLELLIDVRRQGYAVSMGQRSAGAHTIAAPVFARRPDAVVGCIGLSMPLGRRQSELTARYIGLVQSAAADLTLAAEAAFENCPLGTPGDYFSQLKG